MLFKAKKAANLGASYKQLLKLYGNMSRIFLRGGKGTKSHRAKGGGTGAAPSTLPAGPGIQQQEKWAVKSIKTPKCHRFPSSGGRMDFNSSSTGTLQAASVTTLLAGTYGGLRDPPVSAQ